jgi:hypothetical protein
VYRGYIEAVTKEHRSSNKETTKQIGYEDGENEENGLPPVLDMSLSL